VICMAALHWGSSAFLGKRMIQRLAEAIFRREGMGERRSFLRR
jgi:hypothetical protein